MHIFFKPYKNWCFKTPALQSTILLATGSIHSPIDCGMHCRTSSVRPSPLHPLRYKIVLSKSAGAHEEHGTEAIKWQTGMSMMTWGDWLETHIVWRCQNPNLQKPRNHKVQNDDDFYFKGWPPRNKSIYMYLPCSSNLLCDYISVYIYIYIGAWKQIDFVISETCTSCKANEFWQRLGQTPMIWFFPHMLCSFNNPTRKASRVRPRLSEKPFKKHRRSLKQETQI